MIDAAVKAETATLAPRGRGFGRLVSSSQRDKNGKIVATVKNPPRWEKKPPDGEENSKTPVLRIANFCYTRSKRVAAPRPLSASTAPTLANFRSSPPVRSVSVASSTRRRAENFIGALDSLLCVCSISDRSCIYYITVFESLVKFLDSTCYFLS